jgi:5'-methylthioadenosine phosphorylase
VLLDAKDFLFAPRHGLRKPVPPHKVNHRANIAALAKAGATDVVGVCSVGALKTSFHPGMIVVPEDYVSFGDVPTFFDKEAKHMTPSLDNALRRLIVSCGERLRLEMFDGGVYVQTRGPRLETKAEVRFLATLGDVVGMTMASEATLAQEAGLAYAGVCSVDNYAHGIVDKPLNFEEVIKTSREKQAKMMKLVDEVVKSR